VLSLRRDRFWVRNIYIYRDPYEAGPDHIRTGSTGTWSVEDDVLVLEWDHLMGDPSGHPARGIGFRLHGDPSGYCPEGKERGIATIGNYD